jgi:MerR family copper efflux transcriptional regulator
MKADAQGSPRSDTMSIGELARRVRVSTHTIRYYEKIGVLEARERAPNGYRIYSEEDLYALRLVRRAKVLGLSLVEIREMARTLREDPTEHSLISGSVRLLTGHLDKARRKKRELDAYISLVEGEIHRLERLL